jgi:hypothetical protein
MNRCLLTCTAALLLTASGIAAPLKVSRAIGKQPRYAGKPQYCLLVFGKEGKGRVWLVRDGNVLYVDKNGDGDLTGADEKISNEGEGEGATFHAGTVRAAGFEHRNLSVFASRLSSYGKAVTDHPISKAALAKNRSAELMTVSVEVQVPGLKGDGDGGRLVGSARFDADGPLLFSDSPATAPVIHFGGPLQLSRDAGPLKLYPNLVHDLMLEIGTPGIGPGTFATVGYEKLVPAKAFVRVEAEFPAAKPGDKPVKQSFDLKHRC